MLKLNKMLSKKIKFPLSLHGLFPFCHSRESGNPSHLSLRGAKQRNNLSGFSLIELMVAAVILAIALLGIFQAYSVGFMGMADARDRTVATNYLRETIEDFKNMNFNKVKDEPITLIPGTKFHRGSIVLDLEKKGEVVTLKKVITQVRWMDRKGNIKTEEASTILYNKPNTSEVSDAGGIILYATPYYTILPKKTVDLTAEIKDENGNTITDWEGNITFSVITDPPNDTQVGYINPHPQTVHTTDGTASIIFYAIDVEESVSIEGIEKIQASANLTEVGEVTDTVNIRVSTGAVGIILEPVEGDEILPTDETATINVTIVKADYITPIAYDGDITLSTTGPGTLSNNTINGVPSGQTAVTLTSTGTPGVVEITASAPDLDGGYTEVTFTGEAKSILVSAKKKSIYPDEETTITVTIVDENNKPVSFGTSDDPKIITLSAAPDYGVFDDNSNPINLTFEGESSKTCVFKASSIGEFPQEVTIAASDSLVELNSGSTNIEILSPLVAHHIDVTFDPSIIELDDDPIEPSKITAIMKSEDGDIVYGNFITFEITNGIGSFSFDVSTLETTLTGGMATATLYPYDVTSTTTAYIKIYSNDLESNPEGPLGNPVNPIEIEVLFHKISEPHHINLIANPSYIFVGGDTCVITATIEDEYNVPINCSGNITFSIIEGGDYGELIGSTTVELDNASQATIILSSELLTGTVIVKADANLTAPSTITLTSTKDVIVKPINLILVGGSVEYWSNNKIVTFNIEIDGPTLNLSSMKVEWDYSPSKLRKIEVKSPYTADIYDPIIDTGNATSPHIEDNINTNLLPGESTIRLTFSTNMEGKYLKVTFNTSFGDYIKEYIIQVVE